MYKHLFNRVKRIIPKISETEIIALKSGGVSIDREIFKGKINYENLLNSKNIYKITPDETVFIKSTQNLFKMVGQNNIYPNKNSPEYNKLYQDVISVGEFKIEKHE
jgi:hypothetical protein